MEDDNPGLSAKCMEVIECDTARVSKSFGDMLYLIIGFNRNTKDDPGQWEDENGVVKDWDYVQEKVVASGETEADLMESAREYQRLCGMTMLEYLTELTQVDNAKKGDSSHA